MKFWSRAVLGAVLLASLACGKNSGSTPIDPADKIDGGTPPGSQKPIQNKNPGSGHAILLGDSIAASYRAKDFDSKLSTCFTRITGHASKDSAVPGATTASMIDQLTELNTDDPRIIFFSIGGNDAIQEQYGSSFPADASYENFRTIMAALRLKKALIVYLGLKPPMAGGERLPELAKIAEAEGAVVVDGMQGMWGDKRFMADQIHPNDEGYRLICSRLRAALKGSYP